MHCVALVFSDVLLMKVRHVGIEDKCEDTHTYQHWGTNAHRHAHRHARSHTQPYREISLLEHVITYQTAEMVLSVQRGHTSKRHMKQSQKTQLCERAGCTVLPFIYIPCQKPIGASNRINSLESIRQSLMDKHMITLASLQLRADVGCFSKRTQVQVYMYLKWDQQRPTKKPKQRCCYIRLLRGVIITIRHTICSECTKCTNFISAKLRLANPERERQSETLLPILWQFISANDL